MTNPTPDQNPYASPTNLPEITADKIRGGIAATLKKYREQIQALGAFWLIIGGLVAGLGIYLLTNPGRAVDADEKQAMFVLAMFMIVLGLGWVTVGLLTCLKIMPAVYAGLVVSYLSLLGNLLQLNLCGIIIVVVVIVQAHRVIGFAKKLQAAGIPLNAKPTDVLQ